MDYGVRRAGFHREMRPGAAIIPAARIRLRNGDSDYAFRQDSDFLYLTGFDEPDGVLVLTSNGDCDRSVLFLNPRDPKHEVWTGRRLGPQAAPAHLRVDEAYPVERLDELLPELLNGSERLYYTIARDEAFDRRVNAAIARAAEIAGRTGVYPREIRDVQTILDEMRVRKDPSELAIMRRAAAITERGFGDGMRATRPGMTEFELQAHIEFAYRRSGAQAEAYTSIVAGGSNATILHYSSNRMPLRDGELVLVDSGCELDGYATDVTRTWPINGRFSAEQRAIYEIVLAAQQAGIDRVVPGAGCRDFHDACVRTITQGLVDIGLLTGSVEENIETQTYRRYYMHGSGHWLGLDVHDAGRYDDGRGGYRHFEPGMVTTVEPGIYIDESAPCDTAFKGIGVRIEDDILVTPGGNESLTVAIPKQIAELERIVGSAACV